MSQWETVIGLEIHVQLQTNSKIFSGSSTQYGSEPNTQASAVDIALPGVLPVLNKKAVELAIRFGLAIGAKINQRSIFARKNYFYPDLPKGYQISQFELPVVDKGSLSIEVDGQQKIIGITRAHLEEDAGKSLHENFHGQTGIDLNRAGTPLLEIVSEPDLRSAADAAQYAKKIHSLVRFLEISDGNMQEGSFRMDANVSVRKVGDEKLGTRAEVKNVNSFRFLEKAINYEVERQIDRLEAGEKIVQETRLYDADLDETRSMRSKEEAHDYRYFPDPDLPALHISSEWIEAIKAQLPELPHITRQRFISDYEISFDEASILTESKEIAQFFEQVIEQSKGDARNAANWIIGEINAMLNKSNLELSDSPIQAEQLGKLISRVNDQTINRNAAKKVFQALWDQPLEQPSPADVDSLIESLGLKQVSDTQEIEKWINDVIAANPKQVQQFKEGNEKVIGFFMGQIMKISKGQANPGMITPLLTKILQQS